MNKLQKYKDKINFYRSQRKYRLSFLGASTFFDWLVTLAFMAFLVLLLFVYGTFVHVQTDKYINDNVVPELYIKPKFDENRMNVFGEKLRNKKERFEKLE